MAPSVTFPVSPVSTLASTQHLPQTYFSLLLFLCFHWRGWVFENDVDCDWPNHLCCGGLLPLIITASTKIRLMLPYNQSKPTSYGCHLFLVSSTHLYRRPGSSSRCSFGQSRWWQDGRLEAKQVQRPAGKEATSPDSRPVFPLLHRSASRYLLCGCFCLWHLSPSLSCC